MESYDTLTEALTALRAQGYDKDLNIRSNWLEWGQGNKIDPEEFNVDKFFRFEGPTDPDDESIVYAISSEVHGIKGVLVNAFGIYSESGADKLMKKLNFPER